MFFNKSNVVQVASGSPILIILFTFIQAVILKDFQTIMFFLLLCIATHFDSAFKMIFKSLMGTKTWPILGKGTRPFPKEADCSMGGFKHICTSYGMPSGHVLYAAIFSSYWIARLFKAPYKILTILFFTSFTLFVMYSRVVWGKAHTWQQAVVGAILGSLIGWHYYGFVNNIKSKYMRNL